MNGPEYQYGSAQSRKISSISIAGKSPDSLLFDFNCRQKPSLPLSKRYSLIGHKTSKGGRRSNCKNFGGESMADKVDVNAKWDACLDLTVRRFVYSSLAGAFGGLLLFRTPVTRWASVAFGAGVGIGSAYTECSRIFDEAPATLAHLKPSTAQSAPVHDEGGQE